MAMRERKVAGEKPAREVEGGNTDLKPIAPLGSGPVRTVGLGRTINMGDFNFCRVDVAFTFALESLPTGLDATDCARSVCDEILNREVGALLKEERKDKPFFDSIDALRGRRLRVTYGVTRSPRPYESVRFDITVDEPISDGLGFAEELLRVQGITGKFIQDELRGSNSGNLRKQYGY